MGVYLTRAPDGTPLPAKGKADVLKKAGAVEVEVSAGKMVDLTDLVLIIDNGNWDAAALADDDGEVLRFLRGQYGRPYTWLRVKNAALLVG